MKNKACEKSKVLVPGVDKFLQNFLTMYDNEYGKHQNCLMFCPVMSYAAKENGHQNPLHGTNVLNFFLALSAIDKREFDFVSANLRAII